MENDISKRECSLSEIMVQGWSVYCQQFKSIAILLVISCVPFNIIYVMVPKSILELNYVMIPMVIIELLFSLIASVGIVFLAENAVENGTIKMNWHVAISKALTRFGSYAITSLIAGLIVIGLTLLLVIPGLIWMVYYTFVLQVVVLRGMRGKDALDYSKNLVKKHWWKMVWIDVILILIPVAINCGQEYLSVLLPNPLKIIVMTGIDILEGISVVVTTILFLNLDHRANREGLSGSDIPSINPHA